MDEVKTTEIKQLELEISFYKEQTAQNIIEIGKRLIKAKEMLPHGEWGKWLEEKVEFSQRNANRFMQVATEFSNSTSLTNLTQTKVFKLLSLPQEERDDFIAGTHQVNGVDKAVVDMTTRELEKAIKEKNEITKLKEKLEQDIESYKHQQEILLEENKELKNQKPEEVETIVEKIPDDYYQLISKERQLQDQLAELERKTKNQLDETEYDKLRKELTAKSEEIFDLKKQLEQAVVIDSKEVHLTKLKDTAITFSNRVHSFINSVGGLGWMIDYLDEIPQYEKEEYIKAVELLDQWVTTIKSNL